MHDPTPSSRVLNNLLVPGVVLQCPYGQCFATNGSGVCYLLISLALSVGECSVQVFFFGEAHRNCFVRLCVCVCLSGWPEENLCT